MSIKITLFILITSPILCFAQLTEKDKDILRLELAERINSLRISKGLSPLKFNDTLQQTAEFHSKFMAEVDVLSHEQKKSKYRTPKDRVIAFEGVDFKVIGENVLVTKQVEFPLKKKDLIVLADEMFNSWKNSPGHYANMTEPEYVYADLGFKEHKNKQIIYATQVFGTKGHIVENQVSKNSFGLVPASKECDKEFKSYSNLVMNMGNNLTIEGDEVSLYYHDIEDFKKIFSGPNDGVAIDLISKNQLLCEEPNKLDLSPVYDGILLEPFFSAEMLANNRAKSDYRIITKVGDVPNFINGYEYSPSLILIKDGKSCKYIYPAFVPSQRYELRPFKPITVDEPSVELVEEGVVRSQIVSYDFKTNLTKATEFPVIIDYNNKIHSVQINSFSSVEGDSIHNAYLHNSRANFIKNHVRSKLNVSSDSFVISAKENWDEMNFQLNYFERDELAELSHDSLKVFLANHDDSLPWDSLLFSQRKSIAIINYHGEYSQGENKETLSEFNLRTAVANGDVTLANKALYVMYESSFYEPSILFEPQIVEFIKKQPKTVANYAALLSLNYNADPYFVTAFIHSWLNNSNKLDNNARTNLLHLYTLVGIYLLNNWDVSAERLSNVIHPLKIDKIASNKEMPELILNLHLTFIQYFGQVNDGPNISKSFDFIVNYFKNNSLKPEDDVDLALFFNNWSMYHMTAKHLLSRFVEEKLNEDGLFVLAQTMNFTNYNDESGAYLNVHKKALQSNTKGWCEWLEIDFQVKRNFQIKRLYCETCE